LGATVERLVAESADEGWAVVAVTGGAEASRVQQVIPRRLVDAAAANDWAIPVREVDRDDGADGCRAVADRVGMGCLGPADRQHRDDQAKADRKGAHHDSRPGPPAR
jgi:hypothetical protein